MSSKKFMYEVFWLGEVTFQGSSKVQAFCNDQTMKCFRYLDKKRMLYGSFQAL